MKSFSKWTIDEVEETFQIVLHDQTGLLKEWLSIRSQHLPDEEKRLVLLRKKLWKHVFDWKIRACRVGEGFRFFTQ